MIDNKMAVDFIAQKGTMTLARLSAKHAQKEPKTTVIHLDERNDFYPPHSGLTVFYPKNNNDIIW